MMSRGKLYLVSVGPGIAELIPPLAETALRASDVIVGYELYLTWIRPWIEGKAIFSIALTQERAMAAVFRFNVGDVWIRDNLLPRLRQKANKRIVRGVQDERGDADAVENVSGSGPVVVVISAGKTAIVGRDLVVKIAQAGNAA